MLNESVLAWRGPGVRVNALGVPQSPPHWKSESARLWRLLGDPGVRVIAKQFGVNPGTVQRISRPFEPDAVAL